MLRQLEMECFPPFEVRFESCRGYLSKGERRKRFFLVSSDLRLRLPLSPASLAATIISIFGLRPTRPYLPSPQPLWTRANVGGGRFADFVVENRM